MFDLVIKNCRICNAWGCEDGDIAVRSGRIERVDASVDSAARKELDCQGATVLPGLVDPHVHLRQPGAEHKETWSSGTKAAVASGITCVIDMPNNTPPVVDEHSLATKLAIASSNSWCDFSLFVAGFADNAQKLAQLMENDAVAGVKLFLGSTTGSMLCTEESLPVVASSIASANVRKPVAVHSELESILGSPWFAGQNVPHHLRRPAVAAWEGTKLAIETIAGRFAQPLHICHTSTQEEVLSIGYAKHKGLDVSAEATPHHLLLDANEHESLLGPLAKMNPPLRHLRDRQALLDGLKHGSIDFVATDHAPHTLEEKSGKNPPSGVPGLDTMLQVLLLFVGALRLELSDVARIGSYNAAKRFGLAGKGAIAEGCDADIVVLSKDWMQLSALDEDGLHTKCKWSPFAGMLLPRQPEMVFLRGELVASNGAIVANTSLGRMVRVEGAGKPV